MEKRCGWNRDRGAYKNKGTPKGNINAKGNSGGAAPKGNQNAVTHGFFLSSFQKRHWKSWRVCKKERQPI